MSKNSSLDLCKGELLLKNTGKQLSFILLKHRNWKIHMLKYNSYPEETQNCSESSISTEKLILLKNAVIFDAGRLRSIMPYANQFPKASLKFLQSV